MKITVNDSSFNCPGSWAEVTFKQFLELAEAGENTARILSIFSGVPEETIRKAKLKNSDIVLDQIKFIQNTKMSLELPSKILGFKVPHNLELETIGQYEDAKLIFKECPDGEELKRYPELIGTFVNPAYLESNDEDKDKFGKQFWQAPCEEVMAIGNFFLAKRIASKLNLKVNYHHRNTPLKKFKLALTNFRARMAFMVRFYSWKRRHLSTGTSLSDGK